MITIGIDIGITGAISAIDANGDAVVRDLPIRQEGGEKRIDAAALVDVLHQLAPEGATVQALIEDIRVRTMAGHPMAHSTEHSLAHSRGIVQAALDVAGFASKAIQPMTWKRFFGLIGSDKDAALAMARSLYPHLADEFKRKKDHNRAESLLIAHFGQRTMT